MMISEPCLQFPQPPLPLPVLAVEAGCREHHSGVSQSDRRGAPQADALLLTTEASQSTELITFTQCSAGKLQPLS